MTYEWDMIGSKHEGHRIPCRDRAGLAVVWCRDCHEYMYLCDGWETLNGWTVIPGQDTQLDTYLCPAHSRKAT